MTPAVDPNSLGGRVLGLMTTKGVRSARALAQILTQRGYSVTGATISNIAANRVAYPNAGVIRAIAEWAEVTEDELLHGPRNGESFFITELSGLVDDLEQVQRDQILYLANGMARQTRERREEEELRKSMSDDELTLIRLARTRPGMLDALLSQAQAASGSEAGRKPKATR